MIENLSNINEDERYFIFRLGDELYGTPLLGVREVIQIQDIKPVPNTVPHFLGVVNIRGQIVGVVDLRIKFSIEVSKAHKNALVIFDTEHGSMAAYVDQVESVTSFPENGIDKQRKVHSSIPAENFLGIGTLANRLVTLIDLNRALGAEKISSKVWQ